MGEYNEHFYRICEYKRNAHLLYFYESIRRGIINHHEWEHINDLQAKKKLIEIKKLPIDESIDVLSELEKLKSNTEIWRTIQYFDETEPDICKIFIDIFEGRFRGNIPVIDRIIKLFEENGVDINTIYENGSLINQCTRLLTKEDKNVITGAVLFLIRCGANLDDLDMEFLKIKNPSLHKRIKTVLALGHLNFDPTDY